ncbi:MAG: PspC domain-containing protein, partial [Lactobacillaceae bacterium]|nr:PspC domain-containing protein [Lactobacillaceae bacterium]
MTREQRYKQKRRLTRSASDRYLAGVFGGLGQYFKINPKWLRIGYAVLTILTSIVPGVLIYLLMAVIMPADPQPFNFFDWL